MMMELLGKKTAPSQPVMIHNPTGLMELYSLSRILMIAYYGIVLAGVLPNCCMGVISQGKEVAYENQPKLVDGKNNNNAAAALSMRGGGGRKDGRMKHQQRTQGSNQKRERVKLYLANTKPFVPINRIAEMTLKDLELVFRYAIDCNRDGFDANVFARPKKGGHGDNDGDNDGAFGDTVRQQPVNVNMLDVMEAMDRVTAKCRGVKILPAQTQRRVSFNGSGPLSPSTSYGDVDALQFCAAMRLLGEWRSLRQVPPGFKKYAIGMNLGRKDIVQNIAKVEQACHGWIEARSSSLSSGRRGRIDTNGDSTIHKHSHVGEIPLGTNLPRYSPTIRQLMLDEIKMDIHPRLPRLKENSSTMGFLWLRRQLQYQTVTFGNVLHVPERYPTVISAVGSAYNTVFARFHGWTIRKIFNYSFKAAPDADLIFRHMDPKHLNDVVTGSKTAQLNYGMMMGRGKPEKLKGEALKKHISHEMEKNARQGIVGYMEVVNPLLRDLKGLFAEMNCDDPKKV